MFSSTFSTMHDSFPADSTVSSWSTSQSAVYVNPSLHQSRLAALPTPLYDAVAVQRADEPTWFSLDAGSIDSPFHRSSLSPLPLTLTGVINSLYLPQTPVVKSPPSDETESPYSPTSTSSSPPPLLAAADEYEAAATVRHVFPSPAATSTSPPTTTAAPLPLPSAGLLSAPAVSRKRVLADESERAARAERKRRRHRAIDLARRQRETGAIARLNQLLSASSADKRVSSGGSGSGSGSGSGTSGTSGTSGGSEDSGSELRKDKVTVLEAAVQQLAELQQLVAQLTYDNNAQHDQLHAVRFQLQQTQNALTHLDDETRSHSVYSSAFLSTSLSLFLVSVSTGLVLDANARLLQSTGWQRHHVIGRLLTVPYKHLLHRSAMSLAERKEVLKQRQHMRPLVENEHKQMVPSPNVQQYESSRSDLVDVVTGRREHAYSIWRLFARNGALLELPGSCWAGEWEEVDEEDGGERRQYRRPKHVIFGFSFSEAITIDRAGVAR